MSYLDDLKTESNYTYTLNGAKTNGSTGDACLDFFAVAGGMRYRKKSEQIKLFERAYIENPELAMKLLFYIRDIRRGMGERKLFRTLLRHTAKTWTESVCKNIQYISEFGRWDDLLCLLDTPAKNETIQVIQKQLSEDETALKSRENGDINAHISLLAKWLPSDNTSSPRTRETANKLIQMLGMDKKEYRKIITSLREKISLTERHISRKKYHKINYESVPAHAMLKYRNAFRKNDKNRFSEYLDDVRDDKKLIHTDTLFPYEILRPFFKNGCWRREKLNETEVLEHLWNNLPGTVGNANAISVVDTSGSMYCSYGPLMPALISQAMGLYCAEHCTGVFHNHLITFESTPHLVEIKGSNLHDKLKYISTLDWGGSTNLESVFDLILRTAVKYNAKQDEMPQTIYIFSDMEFDCCMENADKTVYENAREHFEENGYTMPAVVFHNVNSWQVQTPVKARTKGTVLTSGADVHNINQKFDGNVTPVEYMLRILNGERYIMIHA